MLSLDITYYMAYVVLWGIGETTIEFLIIGIPSLPMAVKAMPISKSMTSLLRSFGRQSDTGIPRQQKLAQISATEATA
jgi:hypothetical protein